MVSSQLFVIALHIIRENDGAIDCNNISPF